MKVRGKLCQNWLAFNAIDQPEREKFWMENLMNNWVDSKNETFEYHAELVGGSLSCEIY